MTNDFKQVLVSLEETNLWSRLMASGKPIWLYGMGDGALKVMDAMARYHLTPAGIFTSDDFYREKIFCGYPLYKFSDVKAMYRPDEFIILLCFAAFRDDLYQTILSIAAEYELYAPDVPVAADAENSLFTPEYVRAHEKEFAAVYDLLADEQSRQVFRDVLTFKCSGQVEFLERCTTDMEEAYRLIAPQNTDVYVDLGAYNGDTMTEFLSYTGGKCRKVLALEPDERNFKKLCAQANALALTAGDTVFEPVNACAYAREDVLRFAKTTGRSGKLIGTDHAKMVEVRACAVDDLLCGSRADVIKLDVEGAEYEALLGCRKTIETYRPRLMVSAYHRNEDLFALPLLIRRMHPEYRVYLRHHRYIPAWETCFYLIG